MKRDRSLLNVMELLLIQRVGFFFFNISFSYYELITLSIFINVVTRKLYTVCFDSYNFKVIICIRLTPFVKISKTIEQMDNLTACF